VSAATLLRGFEARVSEIRGCRLRSFLAGAGPPVVLVHGLGGAATNWTLLAPLLARRHRVLGPDLPGHGGSGASPAPEGLGSLAELVGELLDAHQMTPAAVVGHSLGGDIAVRLAARRPDAVAALVVMAPGSLAASTRLAHAWLRTWGLLRVSRLGSRFRFEIATRPRLRRLAFGGWGAADPEALSPEAVLGFLDGPGHAVDTATAREALISDECRPELERVRCPTLVVWGARDRTTSLCHGFEYARRLRAPLRTLAATGHLLIAERPDDCAALIERFLDGVRHVDVGPLETEVLGQAGGERLHP
jgi:pimeloyl-ACP methyl ester carboxylesterase